jgi:hypothetical protein
MLETRGAAPWAIDTGETTRRGSASSGCGDEPHEDDDGGPIQTGPDDSIEPLSDVLDATVESYTWPFPPEDLGYEMLFDALPPAAERALEALEDEAWDVGASMTSGDLIEIWDMDAVVAALEGAGVRCARADVLVEAAYGPNG